MHRFYAIQTEEGYALSPEDARHALRVLRLDSGAEVEIVAGEERRLATLEVHGDRVFARPGERLPDTEAQLRVTLYQGLPKSDKMDLIVRMATELGAVAVQPVIMSRSVARPDEKDKVRRRERWDKIAREAVKQCGRVKPPVVGEPKSLCEFESELRSHDLLLVPWELSHDSKTIASLISGEDIKKPSSVGIVIGPEGGIEEEEIVWLRDRCSAIPVSLGPRILRTETAGPAALTLVMGFAGEMV